jgi:hypothetical protein
MYVLFVKCDYEQSQAFLAAGKGWVVLDHIHTGGKYDGWYRFRVDPVRLQWFVDRCERHELQHTPEVWSDKAPVPLQHNHANGTIPESISESIPDPKSW